MHDSFGMSSKWYASGLMRAGDDSRWMAAWMLLVRTHTRFWGGVEEQMQREHGLTMARYDVLAQLEMAGGRLGLRDLAAAIALSPSGLSKLLDRMDASGLIRREPDPADQRAAFATITPWGRELVRGARSDHHALLRRTFAAALNDRDLADLARIMRKLDAATRR
jgi:DNA-binding MarR family transcriptional regulator